MKPIPTTQKSRGGYYTPEPISDFLARWAIVSPFTSVLEPSCGDGVLLESSAKVLGSFGLGDEAIARLLHGVEVVSDEVIKTESRLAALGVILQPGQIHTGDFFAFCKGMLLPNGKTYGAIIGNPPFIRYQSFLEEHRTIAFELMCRAGLHPNRLTNSWVPFLVASTFLLNDHGRLGMVIPAELFQVNYAAEIRQFLSDHYSKITIVTFKKLVFDDILEEVVLLLCEKNGGNGSGGGIRVVELNDIRDLASFDPISLSQLELKPMDHSAEKWTQYFLDKREILLLRELRKHPKLVRCGEVMSVDVGVVTGENSFFVLKKKQVEDLALETGKLTSRIVTRTSHLQGLAFTEEDWQANFQKQYPTHLLDLADVAEDQLPQSLKDYLELGKKQGIPYQYKCSIRKRWYVVPSISIPDAFILRQVHGYPKIVLNEAGATSTDTIHRVKFADRVDGKQIASSFLNSLTFAFSEVIGRSYGGGVMTFEPSESERLPLPSIASEPLDFAWIDAKLRKSDITSVLDLNDELLLKKGLGLDNQEAAMLRVIWEKLRNRRMERN